MEKRLREFTPAACGVSQGGVSFCERRKTARRTPLSPPASRCDLLPCHAPPSAASGGSDTAVWLRSRKMMRCAISPRPPDKKSPAAQKTAIGRSLSLAQSRGDEVVWPLSPPASPGDLLPCHAPPSTASGGSGTAVWLRSR